MDIDKSTHQEFETELFAPIIKNSKGKYIAVLSDDSLDRDEERVGKAALEKIKNDNGYLAALVDHKNEALGQVAKWVNRRVEKIGDNTVLIAEAQFFESNPKAKVIKGMLDEGAEFGISIGAMVKQWEDMKYQGKSVRTFTELELLEASFCGIPSNKHGRAMAVAKSYTKNKRNKQMSEEIKFTQKDMDSALEKKSEEFKSEASELKKSIESKDSKISELSEALAKSEKTCEDKDKEKKDEEDAKKKVEEELTKEKSKVTELEKSLELAKKTAVEKQKFFEEGENGKEMSNEDVDKAIKDGKLPFYKY